MERRIVTAALSPRGTVTRRLTQWDYGQILTFTGADLPESYEVYFSNSKSLGSAKKQIGGADGVQIPDEYLTTGDDVFAWVFLHDGASDGETVYPIVIPVTRRPKPSEETPTPVQQDVITQAIAALNNGVSSAAASASDAADSAQQAEASAQAAAQSASESAASAERALSAQDAAEAAQSSAENSAADAAAYMESAQVSEEQASAHETNAEAAALAAEGSANLSQQAASAAASSAAQAAASASEAAAQAVSAQAAAESAEASAANAFAYQESAYEYSINSAESAASAASSATSAIASETAAAASASDAASSASASASSATQAQAAQTAAEAAQAEAERIANTVLPTDKTLTIPDKAADAKATGEAIKDAKEFGKTEDGGLFLPKTANPEVVDANAFLLSDMSGLSVGNGTLALLRGGNITVKQAKAGATEYHVSNTYVNRLATAGLQIPGAVCILDEVSEPTGNFSVITSCTINGAAFTPTSEPDDPDNDIIITVDKSANLDAATKSIRCYQAATKSSSFFAGQMVGGANGLANLVLGQQAFANGGNVVCMVAAQSYNTGHGNAIFGRYHNSRKNRWFMSGTGHDNTNGRAEAGTVVGQYSDIQPDMLFAVGDGVDHLHRSNAFEVKDDGTAILTHGKMSTLSLENKTEELAYSMTDSVYAFSPVTGGEFVKFDGEPGIRISDSTGAAVSVTAKTAYVVKVIPGEVLRWSITVRKTSEDVTGKFVVSLLKTTQTGSSATNNYIVNNAADTFTTDWQTLSGTFTVPAGMEYMRIRIQRGNAGAGSSGAYEAKGFIVRRIIEKSGLFIDSPNNTRHAIVVSDDGVLSVSGQEVAYERTVEEAIETAISGKITAPASPATGAFLVWNGSAWVAQTLATWQSGSY